MPLKIEKKQRAIALRKQGKTYNEILEEVPVAKSTLSVWLRDVGLSKPQKQKLTAKKRAAQRRGGDARKTQRITQTRHIFENSKKEVGRLSKRERLFIGAALYWAEGSKEKVGKPGQGIDFGNTDASMVNFFVDWLTDFMGVDRSDLVFSLYIHENHKHRLSQVIRHWRNELKFDDLSLSYVYYKKHNPRTKRKNRENDYYGTLRVRVRRSSTLQRKISGLIYGITGATWRIV